MVFRNEDNGWTVIELDDGQELHKAVGVLPMVSVGNSLPAGRLGGSPELLGCSSARNTVNGIFPRRKMPFCVTCPPARSRGSVRRPRSGSWKSSAGRRWRCWRREPQRLTEIRGISPCQSGQDRGGIRIPVRTAGGAARFFRIRHYSGRSAPLLEEMGRFHGGTHSAESLPTLHQRPVYRL